MKNKICGAALIALSLAMGLAATTVKAEGDVQPESKDAVAGFIKTTDPRSKSLLMSQLPMRYSRVLARAGLWSAARVAKGCFTKKERSPVRRP